MGALGQILGMGPAHEVQSQRGQAGFRDFGDDQMGGLMRNGSGMSSPGSYNGGYLPTPGMGGMSGGFPGGGQGGMPGMMGGMGGGMGGGMQGGQRPQYPYGIQPPRGLQGGGQQQGSPQQPGGDPLQSLFSMLGGL